MKKASNQSSPNVADAFRRWGYLQADIDPLGFKKRYNHLEIDNLTGPEFEQYRKIYCSKVGAEFMYMPYPEKTQWLADKLENYQADIDPQFILKRLVSAETFEQFIHSKYVGSKWFSLEGLTALIPLVDTILTRAADHGFEVVIIGMAHRGRLSMLHHCTCAEAFGIFACFEDIDPKSSLGGGDTKYHRGATNLYRTKNGKEIRVHLTSNPSHLEAVNPVVMGRVRAKQIRAKDFKGKKILAMLLHGDAAFAGQGCVAESLNFEGLEGYSIGGTVHIITNNLIGFTARPKATVAEMFSSDVAKRSNMPIFHVNAESPEDVVRIGQIAMDYRATFSADVLIDLVGYRRSGHNEMDDATTTSPVLYEKIKNHPRLPYIYAKQIGITSKEIETLAAEKTTELVKDLEIARSMTKQILMFGHLPEYWSNYRGGLYDPAYEVETAVSAELIKEVIENVTKFPDGFNLHPKVGKAYEQRLEMGLGKRPIDWGAAEMLAFGTLLLQGSPVRITGQDARRATFNQRMAVLYDTKTEEIVIPLSKLCRNNAFFEVYDTQLSEAGCVGFEYGFAREYPEALICWEAQFGDFFNGAQIFIDQFLSAGEDKWGLLSAVTMLLPHGYEGMGPEHSSARIERFLQLCAEDNMQVCYPSTSAQYFHLLRRQALQKWRKPLIIFTPKSMLRVPAAAARLEELTQGKFQQIIDDLPEYAGATRVLLASGKIVHELRAERTKGNHSNTAILTIEQFYPFPEKELIEVINKYQDAQTLVWVQEEPANMGALFFVKPILDNLANGKRVSSVKRSASASPSTGSHKAHVIEQEALLKLAFAEFR